MNRLLVCCGLLASGLWLPESAGAAPMDPALSRLRIAWGAEGCENAPPFSYCPDEELFERMVSELAVSMAPPVNHPARSVGPRGFHFGLDSTLTTLQADQLHWGRGSEGGSSNEDLLNHSPWWFMIWNRAEARKGLPFGFELGASLAQAVHTSLWSYGLHLKWALFEGFHSGLGRLPDVAVGAGLTRSLGSQQLSVDIYAVDLVLSKRFVVERAWYISPLLGVQAFLAEAQSGVVDLTPGGEPGPAGVVPEDAFGACAPLPGTQIGPNPTLIRCADGERQGDFINNVVFDEVSHWRLRLAAGGRARFDFFTVGLNVMLDLATPGLDAEVRHLPAQPQVARQVAFNLSLGAIL